MGFRAWFGLRNVGYIGFTVLMLLYALTNNHSDPAGRAIDAAFATIVWGGVSLVFGGANLVLMFVALAKRRPARKPIIACFLSLFSMLLIPLST